MADKKISEFESFPGKQDSKTHYVVSSGDSGGSDTTNYKVSFTDLVSGISGELGDSLGGGGGGEGSPGPGGSFNFGPTDPSNNSDVINFNQGETVRMYIDENGGVNVSEKLVVANGKETILGGNTTIKETLTVEDGKATTLGGPVTIKGSTTHEGGLFTTSDTTTTLFKGPNTFGDSASDITNFIGTTNITGPLNLKDPAFSVLTSDPNPSTGKLYRKGDDLYFNGKKLLTDGAGGGAGKWSDGTTAGQIHYSGGNVGIGTDNPNNQLSVQNSGATNSYVAKFYGSNTDKNRIAGILDTHKASFDYSVGALCAFKNNTETEVFLTAEGDSYLMGGNVGIGTMAPTSLLSVKNSSQTGDTSIHIWNNSDGALGSAGMVGAYTSFGVKNWTATSPDFSYHMGIDTTVADSPPKLNIGYAYRKWSKPGDTTNLVSISSSGNVGIGTDVPDTILEVNKSEDAVVSLLTLSNYDHTDNSTNHGAALNFGLARDTGTKRNNAGQIYVGKDEVWTSADNTLNSFMAFNVLTNMVPSEKMRITSNGVGIGTDPAYRLHTFQNVDDVVGVYIENTATRPYGVNIVHSNAQGTQTGASTGYFFNCQSLDNAGGSIVPMLAISNNGNVSNRYNTYGAISDIKLKENIIDATSKTEDLKQVRVVNFNFKSSPDDKQIGVIAQELEDVFPGMVYETEDLEDGVPTGETSKAVKYSVFVPILVKAFQEQQAIIEDLKSRIESLENQ